MGFITHNGKTFHTETHGDGEIHQRVERVGSYDYARGTGLDQYGNLRPSHGPQSHPTLERPYKVHTDPEVPPSYYSGLGIEQIIRGSRNKYVLKDGELVKR